MIPQEYIRKKQAGAVLSSGEISEFFSGYLRGEVADYQMSAMLMSCFFNPLTVDETVALTRLMQHSGRVFQWPGVSPELIVDKHSTGGVGDKTSIVLLPLCLLEGLYVPMISGRGLGHTGGTVDKLESIPGFSMSLPVDVAERQLKNLGGFFMSQTQEIAPLDRKLYALRDVTATVASLPLITSSILAKKLAEGISALVADIKFGSGAFLPGWEEATKLARMMKEVSGRCGLKIRCVLSSMNSPLGTSAGNLLEIVECMEVLKGKGPEDTRELSLRLASEMLMQARPELTEDSALRMLAAHLDSGRAYDKFAEIVTAQGGKPGMLPHPGTFEKCVRKDVTADRDGTIFHCNVRSLGLAVIALGGGRKKLDDKINPKAGLSNLRHVGDQVVKGEPLCTLYAENSHQLQEAYEWIRGAYKIEKGEKTRELIREVI